MLKVWTKKRLTDPYEFVFCITLQESFQILFECFIFLGETVMYADLEVSEIKTPIIIVHNGKFLKTVKIKRKI